MSEWLSFKWAMLRYRVWWWTSRMYCLLGWHRTAWYTLPLGVSDLDKFIPSSCACKGPRP